MTGTGLSRLLAILDSDEGRAGAAYEELRRTLLRFFDWNGAWPADELTDVVLDRLVEKIDQGTAIEDARRYAKGIARFVLLEQRRQPIRVSLDQAPETSAPTEPDGEDPRQACFDRCLGELPHNSRNLALEFYGEGHGRRIEMRRQLARRMKVSDTGLRSRVRRVRERLEQCVDACLERNG